MEFSQILVRFEGFLSENAGEFFAAVLGAIGGAMAGYWFQIRAERLNEGQRRRAALRSAQMVFTAQVLTLRNIQTQFLHEFRSTPERERFLPQIHMQQSRLELNLTELGFVFDSDANLILRLHVADLAYQTALATIANRNSAFESLYRESKKVGFNPASGVSSIAAHGGDLLRLKQITDGVFECVDDAERKCMASVKELYALGKRLFPKDDFVRDLVNRECDHPKAGPG